MLSFAVKMLRETDAFWEGMLVVEDEFEVVVEIDCERRVVGTGDACAVASRPVEELISTIEGDDEQSLRSPFERAFAAIGQRNRRRAGAFEDVEDRLVKVLHGACLGAWRDFNHII